MARLKALVRAPAQRPRSSRPVRPAADVRALPAPAAAQPERAALTPRQACFALGLRNLSHPGAAMRADPALAARLAKARPADCLDAAFLVPHASRVDFARHAARRSREASAAVVPFRDVEFYHALARWLGCAFDAGDGITRLSHGGSTAVERPDGGIVARVSQGDRPVVALVPSAAWLPSLASLLTRRPELAARVLVIPPQALCGLVRSGGATLVAGRLEPIHAVPDQALADRVTTPPQRVGLLLLFAVLALTAVALPLLAFVSAILALTAVLVAYAGTRAMALALPPAPTLQRVKLRSSELPVYSVLIPLYREDGSLAHLVQALRQLDYPADRLDIQFLVEADDAGTREAVLREAHALPSRLTIVPPGRPRTKPRALNVGLRQARGSLVTIYDAEDRPDPQQLRVAAETFAAAPESLASLQARLTIDHVGDSWLTRMFAVEYACLFDHILPAVAGRERLVLLGGTSNHFRMDALIGVGGWDPYNVTEDADLSVRLRRHGYRIATIASETFEEAPLTVGMWLRQRSRWFKGFMQTWLVHNRRPLRLIREIGVRDAIVFHLFILGAIVAALAHCLFTVEIVLALAGALDIVPGARVTAGLQALAAGVGYGSSLLLGAAAIRRRGDPHLGRSTVLWFPLYWLLMGVAVLIALSDLIRRPHHWRKTQHGLARRPSRLRFAR